MTSGKCPWFDLTKRCHHPLDLQGVHARPARWAINANPREHKNSARDQANTFLGWLRSPGVKARDECTTWAESIITRHRSSASAGPPTQASMFAPTPLLGNGVIASNDGICPDVGHRCLLPRPLGNGVAASNAGVCPDVGRFFFVAPRDSRCLCLHEELPSLSFALLGVPTIYLHVFCISFSADGVSLHQRARLSPVRHAAVRLPYPSGLRPLEGPTQSFPGPRLRPISIATQAKHLYPSSTNLKIGTTDLLCCIIAFSETFFL